MRKIIISAMVVLPLLLYLLAGCTEDIPDPLTHEDVLAMLGHSNNGNGNGGGNGNTIVTGSNQIAFASESLDGYDLASIYLVNPDGTGLKLLSSDTSSGIGYAPFWSPDGRLAFVGMNGVQVMNSGGTVSTTLISDIDSLFFDDMKFSWSKNGKIAYSYLDDMAASADIYSIDASSGFIERLTTSSTHSMSYYPSWSPDGTKVAFTFADFNGYWYICTVNVNTWAVYQLTFTGDDSQPAWSPDGTRIAFTSGRNFYDSEIYVMYADGSGQTNLTYNDAEDESPTWSPDGKKIAFQSDRTGDYDIFVMNADGTGQTNISNKPATDDIMPAWSP